MTIKSIDQFSENSRKILIRRDQLEQLIKLAWHEGSLNFQDEDFVNNIEIEYLSAPHENPYIKPDTEPNNEEQNE